MCGVSPDGGLPRRGHLTETGADGGWLLHREKVIPEWVDYNGHMNVAYYVLVFDRATDAVFEVCRSPFKTKNYFSGRQSLYPRPRN